MIETKTKKPIGVILWQGKSELDGERIMVVATGIFQDTCSNKFEPLVQFSVMGDGNNKSSLGVLQAGAVTG